MQFVQQSGLPMPRLIPFLTLCALTLCASGPAQALDFTPIVSETAFRTFVVDKVLVDEFGGRMTLGANGSLTGEIDTNRLRGGWDWRDGAMCRRLVIGPIDQGSDCLRVYIRANTLVLQAHRGTGNQQTFTIYSKR
jgi:hypothetical protein